MDGEEKRQNDGVAIKYTTCSGEHAECCWNLHYGAISIFFFPI